MRILGSLLCVCFCFAVPLAAVENTAADTASPDPAEKETTENGKKVFKDQLVVTAGRQEQESSEKMTDLFKDLPSVDVQGEGPFRGLPVIRGLSSNRVLILVDGQRLNNARESTLFAGIQPGLVDLSEVDRIEVLRGPASVLYGSDAMGGVINIITKNRPMPISVGPEKVTVSTSAWAGRRPMITRHPRMPPIPPILPATCCPTGQCPIQGWIRKAPRAVSGC